MCGGVQFDRDGKTIKTFFPNPKSQLPVLTRQGKTIMVPWGRREQQPGLIPIPFSKYDYEQVIRGSWARKNDE